MRSDIIKKGFERAPHRSLLRATGSIESEDDFNKPFIAICNSYTDCIPGHAHLNEVGMLVKRLVRAENLALQRAGRAVAVVVQPDFTHRHDLGMPGKLP